MSRSLFAQNAIHKLPTICISNCEQSSQSDTDRCTWTGTERESHYNLNCGNFMVKCPNKPCPMSVMRKHLSDHISACTYRKIKCQYCDRLVKLQDLDRHSMECDQHPVACPNNCGVLVKKHDIDNHLQNDCLLSLVTCPNVAVNGCHDCSGTVTRGELASHVESPSRMAAIIQKQSVLINKQKFQLETQEQTIQSLQSQISHIDSTLQQFIREYQLRLEEDEARRRAGTSRLSDLVVEKVTEQPVSCDDQTQSEYVQNEVQVADRHDADICQDENLDTTVTQTPSEPQSCELRTDLPSVFYFKAPNVNWTIRGVVLLLENEDFLVAYSNNKFYSVHKYAVLILKGTVVGVDSERHIVKERIESNQGKATQYVLSPLNCNSSNQNDIVRGLNDVTHVGITTLSTDTDYVFTLFHGQRAEFSKTLEITEFTFDQTETLKKCLVAGGLDLPPLFMRTEHVEVGTKIEYLNRKGKWVGGHMVSKLNRDDLPDHYLVRNDYGLDLNVHIDSIRLVEGSYVLVQDQNGKTRCGVTKRNLSDGTSNSSISDNASAPNTFCGRNARYSLAVVDEQQCMIVHAADLEMEFALSEMDFLFFRKMSLVELEECKRTALRKLLQNLPPNLNLVQVELLMNLYLRAEGIIEYKFNEPELWAFRKRSRRA